MAYEKEVDDRVQGLIAQWSPERKTMFGGTGYLLGGNMICGVNRDLVILRVDTATAEELLKDERVTPFDMTGRPMKGWLQVHSAEVDDDTLNKFLGRCYEFVSGLPPKDPTKKRKM